MIMQRRVLAVLGIAGLAVLLRPSSGVAAADALSLPQHAMTERYDFETTDLTPPARGQWHTIRVIAVGDRIHLVIRGIAP